MKKSKGKLKREKLFNLFSENLRLIKEHEQVRIDSDIDDGYLCPICFEIYDRTHLESNSQNPLTLEDVPPKSLGGKPLILTCRNCNSFCGHALDSHLLNLLLDNDAIQFLPNSGFKTVFEKEGNKMGGYIKVDDKGKLNLHLKSEWSNPKESNIFMNNVFPPKGLWMPGLLPFGESEPEPWKSKEFLIQKPTRANERKAEIALLKSAYLFAFSKFGYSFLINGGLIKVREQILNPEKKILPKVFWVNYEFPKENLGLNFIKKPKELRCYLIIFELETKSRDYQFAIALPGPNTPGLKVYENIQKILSNDETDSIDCELEHLIEMDFISKSGFVWASHYYWNKFCE